MNTPSFLPLLVLFAVLPAVASEIKPGDRCDTEFLEKVVSGTAIGKLGVLRDDPRIEERKFSHPGDPDGRYLPALKFNDLKTCDAATWRYLASDKDPRVWRNPKAGAYWDGGNVGPNAELVLVADDFFKEFDPKVADVLAAADAVIDAGFELGVTTAAASGKSLAELLPGAYGGQFGAMKPRMVTAVEAGKQKTNVGPKQLGPTLRKILDRTAKVDGGGNAVMRFRLAVLALNDELGRRGASKEGVVKRLGNYYPPDITEFIPGLPSEYVRPKVDKATALDNVKFHSALAALIGEGSAPATLNDAEPRKGSLLEPADIGVRNLVSVRALDVQKIVDLARARLGDKKIADVEKAALAAETDHSGNLKGVSDLLGQGGSLMGQSAVKEIVSPNGAVIGVRAQPGAVGAGAAPSAVKVKDAAAPPAPIANNPETLAAIDEAAEDAANDILAGDDKSGLKARRKAEESTRLGKFGAKSNLIKSLMDNDNLSDHRDTVAASLRDASAKSSAVRQKYMSDVEGAWKDFYNDRDDARKSDMSEAEREKRLANAQEKRDERLGKVLKKNPAHADDARKYSETVEDEFKKPGRFFRIQAVKLIEKQRESFLGDGGRLAKKYADRASAESVKAYFQAEWPQGESPAAIEGAVSGSGRYSANLERCLPSLRLGKGSDAEKCVGDALKVWMKEKSSRARIEPKFDVPKTDGQLERIKEAVDALHRAYKKSSNSSFAENLFNKTKRGKDSADRETGFENAGNDFRDFITDQKVLRAIDEYFERRWAGAEADRSLGECARKMNPRLLDATSDSGVRELVEAVGDRCIIADLARELDQAAAAPMSNKKKR